MTNLFLSVTFILVFISNSFQKKVYDFPKHETKINSFFNQKESLNDCCIIKDTPYVKFQEDKLKVIRDNFKRINSISNWASIIQRNLCESAEGGEAKFYNSAGLLEKIVTKVFGHTAQQVTEYYLLKGQISFVFEKTYYYNRPVYWDATVMKENNDNEIFDYKKSEILESRNYFEKGQIIHHINNKNSGTPYKDYTLSRNQKEILKDFNELKSILIKKNKSCY